MSTAQPMLIVAVVSVSVLAWVLLCAFIIGLVIELRRQKRDDAPPFDDTPSSTDCPMHGADCEAWL